MEHANNDSQKESGQKESLRKAILDTVLDYWAIYGRSVKLQVLDETLNAQFDETEIITEVIYLITQGNLVSTPDRELKPAL